MLCQALLVLVIALVDLSTGECSFNLPDKWGSGAKGVFKFDPFKPGSQVKVKVGSSGKIKNVWGAKVTETKGNMLTLTLNDEKRKDVVFLVDGTDKVKGFCGGSSKPSGSGSSGSKSKVESTTESTGKVTQSTSKGSGAGETFEGEATSYGDAWEGGNCGFTEVAEKAHTYFAAMNHEQYDSGKTCGMCAKITCADSKCPSKKSITVQVTNRCPECKKGDIDLSDTGFKELTGSSPSRYQITWQWTDCVDAGFNKGNMELFLKEGSSRFWYAVQPRNHNKQIKSISINGKQLKGPGEPGNSISSYYFMNTEKLEGSLKFEVVAAGGAKKSKTLKDFWKAGQSHDMGFNF